MPVITIDAPVGGINAFDSPENMAPTDAIALDNWICRAGYLESRPLFERHCGNVGPGETLVVYRKPDGTSQLLLHKADIDTWYNVTTSTASAISGSYGGDSTTAWQHTHINGVLVLVCGQDNEIAWNGTTFTDLDYTGSSPAITPGQFINVENFKGRAFYIKNGVCSFWYAEAGSYQGNLTEFSLSSVARYGGYPVLINTWSMDSGTGPDDVFVIVMSTGETLIYQGDDPGDVDNWEIAGSYMIGRPIGYRSHLRYGADLYIMTRSGIVNMVDVARVAQGSIVAEFSRRIWPMIDELSSVGTSLPPSPTVLLAGYVNAVVWENLLIFNIPISIDETKMPVQWVFNIETGTWSRFTGFEARQFVVMKSSTAGDDLLFFNGGNTVNSGADNGIFVFKKRVVASTNREVSVTCSAIPAFTDLGAPNLEKQITAVNFVTNMQNPAVIEVTGYTDFNINGTLPVPAPSTDGEPSSAHIGTFPLVRKWMLGNFTAGWHNLHAKGFYVSMAVQMATDEKTLYWRHSAYNFRAAK